MSPGEPTGDRDDPVGEVVLHSSWRAVIGGYVGPAAFLGLAAVALVRGGFGAVAALLAAGGVALLAVLWFDYPIACRFDGQGVERRMPLRRHRLRWVDIRQFTRTAGRWRPTVRTSAPDEPRGNRGGLVAVVGRRRYLLVDQPESVDEFDRVQSLLERVAPDLVDESMAPPSGTPPTFVYRRRRWRPDRPS